MINLRNLYVINIFDRIRAKNIRNIPLKMIIKEKRQKIYSIKDIPVSRNDGSSEVAHNSRNCITPVQHCFPVFSSEKCRVIKNFKE